MDSALLSFHHDDVLSGRSLATAPEASGPDPSTRKNSNAMAIPGTTTSLARHPAIPGMVVPLGRSEETCVRYSVRYISLHGRVEKTDSPFWQRANNVQRKRCVEGHINGC